MAEDNAPDIIVKRYWELILRKKYLAIFVALCVLSVFTWGSFFWPKAYEASSTVLIEKSSIIDPLIRGVGVSSGSDDRLSSLKNNITSRQVLERSLKKLGWFNEKSPGQNEGIMDRIRRNLNVTVQGARENGTDLFTVSYRGRNPVLVRDLVNTLVREYIDWSLGYKRTDASGAYDFLQSQLMDSKKKLEDSDTAIKEFREKNPGIVPQNETALAGRIDNYQTARIEAEIRLKELLRKRENLQKQLSGEKELTVAMVTNEGSPQGRLAQLNNQLLVLTTRFTDDYPEVIKAKSEIEELKKQIAQARTQQTHGSSSETSALNPIYEQLRQELARTDAEVESFKARVTELSRQQYAGERVLGRMPKEQGEWTKLQRDRSVYQKIYDEMLQRVETAKVSRDLEVANTAAPFKILDAAILPMHPIQPDRVMMILLGLVLGIASAFATVIGLDYLNHSFKDEASIETGLNLSVFATIPTIITEEDKLSAQRLDGKVFAAAGVYLFVIGLVLAAEVMSRYLGIKIINF